MLIYFLRTSHMRHIYFIHASYIYIYKNIHVVQKRHNVQLEYIYIYTNSYAMYILSFDVYAV